MLEQLLRMRQDFSKFTFILIALQKRFKVFLKEDKSRKDAYMLTKISSTKSKWETNYAFETLTPLIDPLERASLINLLRASAKGERGHP